MTPEQQYARTFLRAKWIKFGALFFFVFLLATSILFNVLRNTEKTGNNSQTQPSQSGGLEGDILTVNAKLISTGDFVITPSQVPANPQAGQIIFNDETDTLQYYDGAEFVDLGGGVDSLGGTTGAILLGNGLTVTDGTLSATGTDFTPGTGLALDGTTLNNTGVISITGTADQINASATSGSVTLSLPQSIAISSTPTFAGINLGTALSVSNGGTGATSLAANGVLIGNGTSAITSVVSGVPGECLISTAGAPAFMACPGGGGGGAPTTSAYVTVGNDGTLTGERAITAGTNLTAADGGANGSYTISVVANPTFAGLVTANAGLTVGVGQNFTVNGEAFTDLTGTGLVLAGSSLTTTLGTSVDLITEVTGILPVANGGTGANSLNDLIALGTHTTGNYVAGNTAGDGISISGVAGEGWSPSIAVDATVCRTSGNCVGVGGSGDILNNGQNGTVRIGSNDLNSVILESNNVDRLTIDSAGAAIFSGALTVTGLTTLNGGLTVEAGDTFTINGQGFTDLTGDGLQLSTGTLAVDATVCRTSGNCAGVGGTGDIVNNGQNGTVRIGSNDLSSVILESNNVDRLTIDSAGAATFSGSLTVTGLTTLNGDLTLQAGDTLTIGGEGFTDLTGTGLALSGSSLTTTIGTSVDLTSEVNGVLPIANGGTNASTSQAAINNLSQLTTNGDLLYHNGADSTRLPRGGNGECLLANATTILWGTCTGAGGIASFTLAGTSGTPQTITDGNTLTVAAGTNITTTAGATDTVTIAVVNNPTFSGDVSSQANTTLGDANTDLLTVNAILQGASPLIFEGTTADLFETTFAITDPTADQTITFPNDTGTVCLSSGNCAGGAGGSKWTDAGAVTYLTATTDNVTLGSTSAGGKLFIDGDTDEIQLQVQGNATQTSDILVVENSAGTDILRVNTNGVSAPGSGTESEQFGAQASAAGFQSVALGYQASAPNIWSIAIGAQSSTSGNNSVAIGNQASTSASDAVAIGTSSSAGQEGVALGAGAVVGSSHFSSIALGAGATTTGERQFVVNMDLGFGSQAEGFFGNGIQNASPVDFRLNATSGLGTDIAGADLQLAGGRGTGTGIGGAIILQTAVAGTTGSSLNALATRLTVEQTGDVVIGTGTGYSAQLAVIGESDQEQLVVRANATQSNSNPIIQVQESAGTELFRIHTPDTTSIFLGFQAGDSDDGSNSNVGIGTSALGANSSGAANTAIGNDALSALTSGGENTAIGEDAMQNATSGSWNTAVGSEALRAGGNSNVALGYQALLGNTGDRNIAIGSQAGDALGVGFDNIIIGALQDVPNANGSNQLNIAGFLHSSDYTADVLVLGDGVTSATPDAARLQGTSGSGTDIAGADFTLAGGQGTGTGAGGSLLFQIADPGTTGSSLNSLATVLSLSGTDGSALFKNTTNSTTAFQIQNSSSASLFTIDTTNAGVISLLGNNDGEIQSWTTSGNSLSVPAGNAGGVIANGYIYSIGGQNGASTPVATVQYAKLNADGSTGAWADAGVADLPAARSGNSAVYYNGYIYVFGGYATCCTGTNTIYSARVNVDGTISSWTTLTATLPANRSEMGATVANGYVYLAGGDSSGSSTAVNTVYYAKLNSDGSVGTFINDSFSTLGAGPGDAVTFPNVTSANGYLYVLGGIDNGQGSTTHSRYAPINADGSVGTWATTTAMTDAAAGAGTYVNSGYIYIVDGGFDSSYACNDTAIYYARLANDGTIGSWTTSARTLPAVRCMPGAGGLINNGYLYYLGGYNSGGQSTVYYTSAARIKIGADIDLVGLQGGNLAGTSSQSGQGSVGGSITAGNITGVGALTIQGNANFAQGLGVLGDATFASSLSVDTNTLFVDAANDHASIGTTSNLNAKLAIVGTANEEQLLIRAHSGQTIANPLVLFQDSAGAEIARITVTNDTSSMFFGYQSGTADDGTLNWNVGIGNRTLNAVTTGTFNTALGVDALRDTSTTASRNTAIGSDALEGNTGDNNVAIGSGSMRGGNTGSENAAFGTNVLELLTSGSFNTALGDASLTVLTSGSNNVAIGRRAGDNLTSGSNGIIIGANQDFGATTGNNQLNIAGFITSSNYTIASTIDVGSATVEIDELYVADNNGIRLGLDQDATLAYDEATDDRVELTGTGASLFIEDRLALGIDARTIADNTIGATPATLTLNPNSSYVTITCNDPDGCTVTMDEVAPVRDGNLVFIIGLSATNAITINDSAGVSELAGNFVTNSAYDSVGLIYNTDRWVELTRSDN